MNWKCPCGNVNQESERRCGACGIEITEENYENLRMKEVLSRSASSDGLPIRPAKIEPRSNWKLKERVGGLFFGVFLAGLFLGLKAAWFSSRQIDENTWEFLVYTVVICGACGFVFGEKLFKIMTKVFRWFRHIDDRENGSDKDKNPSNTENDAFVFSPAGFVIGMILGVCVSIYLTVINPWQFGGSSIWTYVILIATGGVLGGVFGIKVFRFFLHF